MKLSKTQQDILAKMQLGQWYTSYGLQCRISTLHALVNKGLLTSKHGLGSIWSPQTSIRFQLKQTDTTVL